MFVPCTTLLYDSTAVTRKLKLFTTPLSISSGIHLISLLMMSSLVCGLFSQTVFQVPLSQNISGITSHWTDSFCVKPITPGHSIPKISTGLTIFWGRYLKDRVCENNPKTREDIIRRETRWILQEMLNGVVDNFNVRVAAVLSYSSAVHGTNIVLITEKV